MENSSDNSKPTFFQNFNEFIKKHEVKEKVSTFASNSYDLITKKAEEYKVKEKTIEFAYKTKEILTPYVQNAVYETKIAGTYIYGLSKDKFHNFLEFRKKVIYEQGAVDLPAQTQAQAQT